MSENTPFTPGPWGVVKLTGRLPIVVKSDLGLVICDLRMRNETAANAQLIAAAPDLYAALEAIENSMTDGRADVPEWLQERMAAGRAALTKACGET